MSIEEPLIVPVDAPPQPAPPTDPAVQDKGLFDQSQPAPTDQSQQQLPFDPPTEATLAPPAVPPRASQYEGEEDEEAYWEHEEYYNEEDYQAQDPLYQRRPPREQWHWAYNRIVQVGDRCPGVGV